MFEHASNGWGQNFTHVHIYRHIHIFSLRKIIGVSLSDPHMDGVGVRELYIYIIMIYMYMYVYVWYVRPSIHTYTALWT